MSDIFELQCSRDRLKRILDSLVVESQRGAVIAGAAELDRCLEALLVAAVSRRKAKGTLAEKIKEVQKSDLVCPRVCAALEALKDVRNSAAHEAHDTVWSVTAEQRKRLWDFGDGMAETIERMAWTALLHRRVSDILDTGIAKKRRMTAGEVVDLIFEEPQRVDSLTGQAVMWEMAIGFAIACALIDQELARRVGP